MDNAPDLWEEQVARLLRSYREPAVPEERLREIGEGIARRLAETGAVEANLNAVLPFYREPEVDADRLAQIGRDLASQLQPPKEETPRRLRAVRRHRASPRSNRAPLVWGLATAAAVLLLVLLASVFSGNPAPRPSRQEAKTPRAEEPRQEAPAPAPPEDPKPPVVPEKPKPPVEKPKEPPPDPPPPAPLPTPRPAPPEPPKETPKPAAPTLTATGRTEVARLERVQGDVFIMGPTAKSPAKAGDPLLPAQGLQTSGGGSSAVVRYADATQVELGPETTVSRFDEGDKKVAVAQGIVTSQITRQPAGRPMIFTTPHAEAKVVGTKLTLWVRPDWTRLEVKEGKVRFTRASDGSATEVGADQYAVAIAGPKPVARRALPATIKGIHLLEDFEDPLGFEARWQLLEGGAPRSTLGALELDLSPRPNESYGAGGWHAAWGARTRQHFPLPLRVSVDVEHAEKHVNANALVVLVPKEPGIGNEVAVHLRDTDCGILVGGKPVKTVNRTWTPPLRERWTVELDRKDVRFLADGKQILRLAHGLAQIPAEYRVELHGGAKMDAPAGARIRYDNVRIEP